MIDGAILGVFIFALGAVAGMALAAYHYRDVLAGQARCIEALEDYIDERSEPEDATAEGLGWDD